MRQGDITGANHQQSVFLPSPLGWFSPPFLGGFSSSLLGWVFPPFLGGFSLPPLFGGFSLSPFWWLFPPLLFGGVSTILLGIGWREGGGREGEREWSTSSPCLVVFSPLHLRGFSPLLFGWFSLPPPPFLCGCHPLLSLFGWFPLLFGVVFSPPPCCVVFSSPHPCCVVFSSLVGCCFHPLPFFWWFSTLTRFFGGFPLSLPFFWWFSQLPLFGWVFSPSLFLWFSPLWSSLLPPFFAGLPSLRFC